MSEENPQIEESPEACTGTLGQLLGMIKILPDAVMVINLDRRIVCANPQSEKLLGYTAVELQGKPIQAYFLDEFTTALSSVAFPYSEAIPRSQIAQWILPNGKLMDVEITKTCQKIENESFLIYSFRNISHYINQQKALIENERRYRGMIESQSALIVCMNRIGELTFVNRAACELLKRTVNELIGTSIYQYTYPEDASIWKEAANQLKLPPYRTRFDLRVKTDDGPRWVAWEICLSQDAARQIYEVQAIGRDITIRKNIEETILIERNLAMILAQTSTLSEALPICLDMAIQVLDMDSGGIYLVDPDSEDLVLKAHTGLSERFVAQRNRVQKSSPQHQKVLRGQPIYQNYTDIIGSKNQYVLEEGLRCLIAIPIHFKGEVIAALNIASHNHDTISTTRRDALENLALQLGNMIARFQMQDELIENQQQLQSMFDTLMDFVFVLDKTGTIIQVNQMVLKRLGYTRDEIIGKNVLEVHPPEARARAWKIVGDMLAGLIDTCPLDLLTKNGAYIPVETKVAAGRWGSQDVLIGVSRDITERKASEALIQEKTREIENFFDLSLDLLCITDQNRRFLRVNKAWEDVLGYPMEDLLHKDFLELTHPDDVQSTIDEVSHLKSGRKTISFVNRYRAKDGGWHYIEWQTQPYGDLFYAAARDITERKVTEEIRQRQTQLLAYRNKFEEILTSISTQFINLPSSETDRQVTEVLKRIGEFEQVDRSYVFLIDEQAQVMNNTHEWCAPGIHPEIENLQNLPLDILPWWMGKMKRLEDIHIPVVAQMPAEAQAEREVLEAQSIQSVLVVPMAVNNTLIGFLGFDSVLNERFWSGESIKLIKMVGEILANAIMRHAMENDLRQSESRNRALLSAVPDLIFRLTPEGVITDYKASTTDLLAVSKEQVIGSSIFAVLDDATAKNARECIEQALKTSQVQRMVYHLKIGDSTYTYEARFKSSGAAELIAIIRDITEQDRLEQMKSDFINRATHELRTPIATMLLMSNLIDGEPCQEEYAEYWTVMKEELSRERRLVEDLLYVGRLENNRTNFYMRSIDIASLVRRTVQPLELTAREKEIDIEIEALTEDQNGPLLVKGDENALSQVFVNLIGNAIKFTHAGGQVKIRVQDSENGALISVIDNGIGIPSEDMPMLFGRFFRGSNAVEEEIQGTGIGLYIVRSIVEKHSGKIQVTSEQGKGSQFDVWLPGKEEGA